MSFIKYMGTLLVSVVILAVLASAGLTFLASANDLPPFNHEMVYQLTGLVVWILAFIITTIHRGNVKRRLK